MATKVSQTPNSSGQAASAHAAAAVLQVAERLFAVDPEWVVFFREVLGVEGIVRRTFSDPAALLRFECSPEYARIREMLDALRGRQQDRPSEREGQRVITVRMPRSLHEALKSEAEQNRVSINTLCISKLMKLLDQNEARSLGGRREAADGEAAAAAEDRTTRVDAGGPAARPARRGRIGADL